MRSLALCYVFILGSFCILASAYAVELEVQAVERDGHVLLSAQFSAPVPQSQAFSVLTDFDHMAEFMPNMTSSRVISRESQHLVVKQQGQLQLGVFNLTLDSEREIELRQMDEIIAHSVTANQGAFTSKMKLSANDKGTQMVYQADWQPKSAFMAGLARSYLQEQVTQQFSAMQREMVRRSKLRLASAPSAM